MIKRHIHLHMHSAITLEACWYSDTGHTRCSLLITPYSVTSGTMTLRSPAAHVLSSITHLGQGQAHKIAIAMKVANQANCEGGEQGWTEILHLCTQHWAIKTNYSLWRSNPRDTAIDLCLSIRLCHTSERTNLNQSLAKSHRRNEWEFLAHYNQ